MTRLSLLADEHVPSAVITALSSNGFDVVAVTKERAGIDDKAVLSLAVKQRRVILTNDRDFVLLADQQDHAGILLYDVLLRSLTDWTARLGSSLRGRTLEVRFGR